MATSVSVVFTEMYFLLTRSCNINILHVVNSSLVSRLPLLALQEAPGSPPVFEHPINSPLDNHERRISNSLYESIEGLGDVSTPRANMIGRMGESNISEARSPPQHLRVSLCCNKITPQIGFFKGGCGGGSHFQFTLMGCVVDPVTSSLLDIHSARTLLETPSYCCVK